jgi:hypothetical protein
LLTINEKPELQGARNLRERKPKQDLTQTKKTKAKAATNLPLVKITDKSTGKKKKASALQVSAPNSAPEVEPDDEIPFYRPASKEDYFRIREMFDDTGGFFRTLENRDERGDPDWINFPSKALYTARSGPPSTKAKRRLQSLAQYMSYMVLCVAHDDGITREKAWELTGLLKSETRGPNMYNAFSHWRARQMADNNGGVPGKCLL